MASELEQAKWLLTQVPMLEVPRTYPGGPFETAWMHKSSVPYGYMNSGTFVQLRGVIDLAAPFHTIGKAPTKWVLIDMLPEGTMVLTPNKIPGMEEQL